MPSMGSRLAVRCSKTHGGSGRRSPEMIRASSRSSCRLSRTRRSTCSDCTSLTSAARHASRATNFGDAVSPVTDDYEGLDRELDDRCEEDALLTIVLVVEVKATTARGQGSNGCTRRDQVACLDQHAAHQVALAADRFVDERVGGAEPPAHRPPPSLNATTSATLRRGCDTATRLSGLPTAATAKSDLGEPRRTSAQQADQTFSDPATVSLRSASWPIGSYKGLSSRTHHNPAVTRSVQR